MNNPNEPFDPMCGRYAKDMEELDWFIREDDDRIVSPEERETYIIKEEGTYNPSNGHFLCDACYIKAGMPSSPYGWKCS